MDLDRGDGRMEERTRCFPLFLLSTGSVRSVDKGMIFTRIKNMI